MEEDWIGKKRQDKSERETKEMNERLKDKKSGGH